MINLFYKKRKVTLSLVEGCFFLIFFPLTSFSQESDRDFYFSWGYNKEWYTTSDIHIVQPELGNDFTLVNATAHDHIGWDKLFYRQLTIPQYNYRLGYFFTPDWAFEINFDHTKYIAKSGQAVQLKGTFNNRTVDSTIVTNDQSFYYLLNNGANFLLFNLVRKQKLYHTLSKNFKADGLLKFGVGPVIPHVENTIFGHDNDPHFQFGGWNVGVEATVKLTFYKYFFLEYALKGDYARYYNLRIYKGLANHAFGTFEMIASAGFNIPITKGFRKKEAQSTGT